MFHYISSGAIIILELVCCNIFFESFCDERSGQKKWRKVLLAGVFFVLDYACILLLAQNFILKQIAIICLFMIIMYLYYKVSIGKALVLSALYQGLLLFVDYIAYIVNSSIFLKKTVLQTSETLTKSLIIVFGKILLFLCVLSIRKKIGKKSTEGLADAQWIRFLFFPVFTIITVAAIIMAFPYIKDGVQANVLYMIAFGLTGMNVVVYELISDIVDRGNNLHEKELLELKVRNQMELFEIQKARAHEFKNQMLCIQALLQDQEYEQAGKYVNGIMTNFSGERNVIDTNHAVVNAILNAKYAEAVSKQIAFVFRVNDLSKIQIADDDLVTLLANLLTNAIEACEKCQERKVIRFKFTVEDGQVILAVKNTYAQPVVYEGGKIKTSKTVSPEEHGMGIRNIIDVIERYHGAYVIQNNENEFYFSILFDDIMSFSA